MEIHAMTLGQAAEYYALALGWKVFPLKPRDKAPLTPNGFHDAAADIEQIREWWKQWPDANIGMPTGKDTAIVLDLDNKPHGPNGKELLESLEAEHGMLPLVPAKVLTGGGGEHLYFAPLDISSWHTPGIDLQANGAYVVLPPSVHASGKRYSWEEEPGSRLDDLPQWLYHNPVKPKGELSRVNAVEILNGVSEGSRNNRLFQLASKYRGADIPYDHAVSLLLEAAGKCQPPYPADETRKIIDGVYQRYQPNTPLLSETIDISELADIILTDSTMADVVASSPAAANFRYVTYPKNSGKWIRWTGSQWTEERAEDVLSNAIVDLTREALKLLADSRLDNDKAAAMSKALYGYQSAWKLKEVIKRLQANDSLAVSYKQFDANPWLLNVANGTVNLETGELQPHNRNDYLTRISPASYDPHTEYPSWQRFISQVTCGDRELEGYLQRVLGLSLIGVQREQILVILYGYGQNGKSVMLDSLRRVLGDYAGTVPTDVLLQSGWDKHPAGLVTLEAKRFVYALETTDGVRLNEALIKQLTGSDPIQIRGMRENFREMIPIFTMFLATNHLPVISDMGKGMWRRIKAVPFNLQIPDDEGEDFDVITNRLGVQEASGLLRWLVDGCLEYQLTGLVEPESVKLTTAEYKDSMDTLGRFLDENCITGNDYRVNAGLLYQRYKEWCKENGHHAIASGKLKDRLEKKGVIHKQAKLDGKNQKCYVGLGLLTQPEIPF